MAFQKFGNMEQSLFARFVRLGVPTVELDAQGRARPRYVSFLFPYACSEITNSLSSQLMGEYALQHFQPV